MSKVRSALLRALPMLVLLSVVAAGTWAVVDAIKLSDTWRVIWLSSAVGLTLAADRTRFANSRTGRRLIVAMMVLLCAGSLYVRGHSRIPKLLRGDYMQGWNVYHYYMGSKYFEELGYFDLYKYTFLADREDRRRLASVRKTRNLHNYDWVPVEGEVQSIETNVFTPERWQEFKADLRAVFDHTSKRTARRMVTDLGYNAPPFGHLLFFTLSSQLSLAVDAERIFLLSIDWLLLIPAFVVFGRAFGPVRAMGVFACFLLFFGAHPFHFGGLLRFFWLATTLVAIACYKLGRFKTAGIFFALAVAERILPLFFLVGPAAHVAWQWFRTKKLPRSRLNFAISFLLGLFMCVLATLPVGRGLAGWSEFGDNMFHHANFQYLVEKKFGVKRIYSHDFAADKQPASSDKARKRKIFSRQEHYYWLTFGLVAGCVLLIYATAGEHNTMLVGMMPAFLLEDISKYYLVLWFFACVVGPPLFRQRYKYAVFDIVVVGLIPVYYAINLHTSRPMTLYTSANFYMVGTIVAMALLILTERPWRRTTAADTTGPSSNREAS